MRFNGILYFRCRRCGYPISIANALGYYPNIGDTISIKCPYCGESY